MRTIVLAYSGGLDTSIIVPWLKEHYDARVICVAADIGQGDELEGVRAKALASGADECLVEDLREEFVEDFLWPMLRAGAIYGRKYLLGTSIARPLIARRQCEVAKAIGADALAHGCTGKGNDQVRFELTYATFAPELPVIAPWREWDIRSREDALAYAAARNIPVSATAQKIYSRDRNLWHISHEGGMLEDPSSVPPDDLFMLSASPADAPDEPEDVTIEFLRGTPIAVNGERMRPVTLVATLNAIGGRHGVGRIDLVEDRLVGMKSRGVYETPGGTLMLAAHRAVESLTLDREVMHIRDSLVPRYAEMVYYGYWFAPERHMLQTAIDESQQTVNGTARLKLYKGSVTVVGRKAAKSLYDPSIASFEAGGVYNQADAEGFIRLSALRLRIQALVAKRGAK
jgi:argininosuccinate synthase